MNTKIGKIVKNNNGINYVVIALCKDNLDRALLHGGKDFVVINGLSYFEKNGSWGGGTYFPCFTDEDSTMSLLKAIKYLNYDDTAELE